MSGLKVTEEEIARFQEAFYNKDVGQGELSVPQLKDWLRDYDDGIPDSVFKVRRLGIYIYIYIYISHLLLV